VYDRGKVVIGLAVFAAVVALPFWLRVADRAHAGGPPELVMPATEKQCVEGKEYMRKRHMDLLNSWRTDVVRHDNRTYVSTDGKEYAKSLTGTCMNCHSDKNGFCDRCHAYNAINPYCWDCHVGSEEGR
jgi:hypothetical protein